MANHDAGILYFLLFYETRADEHYTYSASLFNGISLWSGNNFFHFKVNMPQGGESWFN